jgi:hypothetical protein
VIVDRLENFFASRLNSFLLDQRKLEEELFLCAGYIAKTLSEFVRDQSPRMAAVDYLLRYAESKQLAESDDPIRPEDYLVRGGQNCFVICVFFPVFHRRRCVDEKYYAERGAAFFYQYFLETGTIVAHHMAEHFDELVPITQEAIKD